MGITLRAGIIWIGLALAMIVPVAMAATSPLLAWRQPVYIVGGFAGIVALALLLLQPMLAGGFLPGLRGWQSRRIHRWVGAALVLSVVLHVAGLWITSPPDMIDALTFTSPTPFSAWGVIAMWTLFVAALLGALRGRLSWRPWRWRSVHATFATVTVVGSVVHALQIEGAMETITKASLSALVLAATAWLLIDLRRRARRG